MNENTKTNTPAICKLRESLLSSDTTLSNLALVEMMIQENAIRTEDEKLTLNVAKKYRKVKWMIHKLKLY